MLKLIHSLLSDILGFVKQRPTVKRLRKWGAIIGNDVELICVHAGCIMNKDIPDNVVAARNLAV